MDQNQREWWNQIRRKGKLNFVLVRGGLLWGLPLGIIWNLAEWLFTNNYAQNPSQFFDKGIFMLGGFFVGGCLWAMYDWNKTESKYLPSSATDSEKKYD